MSDTTTHATPEQSRDAADTFAFGLLNTALDVVKEMADSPEADVMAEASRRRDEQVDGVITTFGEEDGEKILAEGQRIALEVHGIMKRHFGRSDEQTARS